MIHKKQFSPNYELKGNGLFKKAQNTAIKFFIYELLDIKHFSICYYDKKFYLATLLLTVIHGTEARMKFPIDYYALAMVDITKKWTGRRKEGGQIHSQLEIFFADRLD